jgi:hypothetical protein
VVVVRLVDELPTRLVPYERWEFSYARNRPAGERPAWPRVGDEVFYRRNGWDVDEDLVRMRVVDVQDPDDTTSDHAVHVNQLIHDTVTGGVLLGPLGRPVVSPVPDPWPWVVLQYEGEVPKGTDRAWLGRPQMTWESRVRGSAGWLPLDYQQTRSVRLPSEVVVQPMAISHPILGPHTAPPAPAPAPGE